MFLRLERRTQAMHVGGLELLVPPKGARTGWLTRLVARLHQATTPKPPFNQRLHRKLGSSTAGAGTQLGNADEDARAAAERARKSTRLNSSHSCATSYAVFCLTKHTHQQNKHTHQINP